MMHQRSAFWIALLLGFVWIFSGYGKVTNTADFIRTVSLYGLPTWISVWAYAIPTMELLLGAALVLQISRRQLATTSLIALVMFTLFYLYGYVAMAIEISFLDSSPLIVIGRNMILISISGMLMIPEARRRPVHRYSRYVLVAIAIGAAFLSGRTSIPPESPELPDNTAIGVSDPFNVTGMRASDTALSGFMPADSSQSVLIFAFSFNCPNCWDAVETIKAYKRSGTVDSIVGVTFGSAAEVDAFSKEFDVDFPIQLVPLREMTSLTTTVPRVFVVKQGRVKATFTSPVMSFRTFNDHYSIGP